MHALHAPQQSDALGAPPAAGAPPLPPAPLVHVSCGGASGLMVPSRQRVLISNGCGELVDVSPTEFERLGGKAAHKRWRSSIRLADDAGPQWAGRCIGDYLSAHGIDAPPASGAAAPSRSQSLTQSHLAPAAAPAAGRKRARSDDGADSSCGRGGRGSEQSGSDAACLAHLASDAAACAIAAADATPTYAPRGVAPVVRDNAQKQQQQQDQAQGGDEAASVEAQVLEWLAQQSQLRQQQEQQQHNGAARRHGSADGCARAPAYSPRAAPRSPAAVAGVAPAPFAAPAPQLQAAVLQQQQQQRAMLLRELIERERAAAAQQAAEQARAQRQQLLQHRLRELLARRAAAKPPPLLQPPQLPQLLQPPLLALPQPPRPSFSLPPAPPGPLPGDGSEAVAIMADYLAGLISDLPDHVLPPAAAPVILGAGRVDLRALFGAVVSRGGYVWATLLSRWGDVAQELLGNCGPASQAAAGQLRDVYQKLLVRFERMYDFQGWLRATGRPSPIAAAEATAASAAAAARVAPRPPDTPRPGCADQLQNLRALLARG